MVEEKIKTNNCFILWNYQIDFTGRGDTAFYDPDKKQLNVNNNLFGGIFGLADYTKGFAFTKDSYTPNGDVGIFRVSDIDDILNFNELARVDFNFWDKYNNFRIKPLDIIMTVTGNTVGKCFLMPADIPKMLMNQNAMILRAKENVDAYFLYSFFLTDYFKNEVKVRAHSGTRPFLDLIFFQKIQLPTLNLTQKEKIKTIVKNNLSLKESAEQEYKKAKTILDKELKNYLNTVKKDKTFIKWSDVINWTERLDPFFYFENEYEKNASEYITLGDFADVLIGKTPAYDDYIKSGCRILKFRAIRGNGLDWINEERAFVRDELAKKYKNKLERDDIVLGCAAHQASYIGSKIDVVDYIPAGLKNVLTVAEIMSIKTARELNPYVLLLFLRSQVGYELIQRQVKGQTSHLYPKDVKQIKLPKKLLPLSQSDSGKEIERLIKSSLQKKREAKERLEEAKNFVENLL